MYFAKLKTSAFDASGKKSSKSILGVYYSHNECTSGKTKEPAKRPVLLSYHLRGAPLPIPCMIRSSASIN